MSRCRKPTEWMASMDSRICFPSLRVVLMVKVPLGWLLRRSARLRPWVRDSDKTAGLNFCLLLVRLKCVKIRFQKSNLIKTWKMQNWIWLIGDTVATVMRNTPGSNKLGLFCAVISKGNIKRWSPVNSSVCILAMTLLKVNYTYPHYFMYFSGYIAGSHNTKCWILEAGVILM